MPAALEGPGADEIGICMGEIGTPTRILAGKFGAPFTYATLHHERKLAPGQISYKMMRDIYRYESINADTEVYAVIADRLAQDEGSWEPFRRTGVRRFLYRRPRYDRVHF